MEQKPFEEVPSAAMIPKYAPQFFWPEVDEAEQIQSMDNETLLVADRRRKVAYLYSQHKTMRQIRDIMNKENGGSISTATICRDIAAVHQAFLRMAVRHIAEWKADALRKLQFLERETLEQWERSKGATVKTHSSRRTKPQGAKKSDSDDTPPKYIDEAYRVEKFETYGDPRLMALLIQIWDRQAQLFGLVIRTDVGGKLDELPPVKMVAGVNPVELV